MVGKTGEIIEDGGDAGLKVFLEEKYDWWFFPYFVLEKVEDNETPKYVEPVKQEEKKDISFLIKWLKK